MGCAIATRWNPERSRLEYRCAPRVCEDLLNTRPDGGDGCDRSIMLNKGSARHKGNLCKRAAGDSPYCVINDGPNDDKSYWFQTPAPTPFPTPEPAVETVTQDVGPCKGWCSQNSATWASKCNWANCQGCSECTAAAAATSDGDTAANSDDECADWCSTNSAGWQVKCNWKKCLGCSSC